jgi:hypothetical protein
MTSWAPAFLVGLASGTHTATWGMYKDAPHEGFGWRRYSRSILVALLLAPCAAAVTGLHPGTWAGAVTVFGLTYGLERAVVEFYKGFVRDEDQSKYTIPMQFHIFGRVVRGRWRRLAIGGSIAAVVGLLAAGISWWTAGRTLDATTLFLIGGIGGWVSACGGAFKDAPIEGFHWLKFWRSPLLAGAWALVVSHFTGNIVVIAVAGLGYTVATIETYKTFFFPRIPRGKFQGKPVLYPEFLRFRQRFVPIYAALWLLIVLGLLAAFDVPAALAEGPRAQSARADARSVAIDMTRGWVRHDGEHCSDPTRIAFAGGAISFDSRRSAAMVWQSPTLEGPLGIEPTLDWVRTCGRPPLSFLRAVAAGQGHVPLVDLSEYPYLSWRWKVDGAIDDAAIARADGRIRGEKNDFAAKLGVLVQTRGREDAQEVAYVWSRSLPVGTVLYQQWSIPLVFKLQAQRVVVMSGVGQGDWVEHTRDVRADFERLFPGRRAGRVLRVYLQTDSDDTGGQVSAAYAGLHFERALPAVPVADLGGSPLPGRGAGR